MKFISVPTPSILNIKKNVKTMANIRPIFELLRSSENVKSVKRKNSMKKVIIVNIPSGGTK